MTLLEISDLKTYYQAEEGDIHALDGVNLTLNENETIGIVGESGSGKSTLAKSIIQTLPDNARTPEGSVYFEGVDLTKLSEKELRKYRWEEISIIPQSAMNALDPVYTVGAQIREVIRSHRPKTSKSEANERARELFQLVGLEPDRIKDYPHQFSGGMKQRAMIALALALDPKVVIADEPTTALDVITQKNVLDNIDKLRERTGISMLLITHDISVVSERSDKIAVVYGGRIVEFADAETIIQNPKHPYTLGLRNAFPTLSEGEQQLTSIPGTPPDLLSPEPECRFVERCPFATSMCRSQLPELREVEDGHYVECIRVGEAEIQTAADPETWRQLGEQASRGVNDD